MITLTLCAVGASYLVVKLLWINQLYPKLFSPLRHIPGPDHGSFFMGQFWHIWKEAKGEPLRDWAERIPHSGILRYLDLFNSERIVVLSPEALSEVLVTRSYDFIKPSQLAKGLGRILGIGLFLAEGEEHKKQRKDLMSAFTFRNIKDLHPVFFAKSQELMDAMTASTESERGKPTIIDVGSWASRAALDIIGTAGLGADFHAIQDPTNELYRVYQKIFAPDRKGQLLGILSFVLPSWVVSNFPIKLNKDIDTASHLIKTRCRSLIRSRNSETKSGQGPAKDIISAALASGSFTETALTDQVMTFLIAGHETTAASLSWAIYALCQQPRLQTRLRDEILSKVPHFGTSGTVTEKDMEELHYLHVVCNEVLRLYPPVPVTIRVAARDTRLLEYSIPKGTAILLSPWAVNRSTTLWGSEALEFDPDRWITGGTNAGGASSNFAMLTFLHGPRNCIGSAFAKAEFACLLASWVARYETSFADPDHTMKVKNGIAARPANLQVKLAPVRNYS